MQVEETHYGRAKANENFKEINHFCCFAIIKKRRKKRWKNEAYMQACHAAIAITKDTCQKRIKIVAAQQK